jgi:hypothetical protein
MFRAFQQALLLTHKSKSPDQQEVMERPEHLARKQDHEQASGPCTERPGPYWPEQSVFARICPQAWSPSPRCGCLAAYSAPPSWTCWRCRRGRPQVRSLQRRRPGWADPSGDDLTRSLRRPNGAAWAVRDLLAERGRGMTAMSDPRQGSSSPAYRGHRQVLQKVICTHLGILFSYVH